jgi:CheY-like chemotaxis protein
MERTHDPMGARPTVLLVDDEELLRALLSRMLMEAGFTDTFLDAITRLLSRQTASPNP